MKQLFFKTNLGIERIPGFEYSLHVAQIWFVWCKSDFERVILVFDQLIPKLVIMKQLFPSSTASSFCTKS